MYSESCQTSEMEHFAKIVKGLNAQSEMFHRVLITSADGGSSPLQVFGVLVRNKIVTMFSFIYGT